MLIGHNIRRFDNKWCTTKFLKYGLPPPTPTLFVDTFSEAKKLFYLPSYSLDNVADYFGLGHKIHVEGHKLANKCVKGDEKSWRKMKRYNEQDVRLTEKVFNKMYPWIAGNRVFRGIKI